MVRKILKNKYEIFSNRGCGFIGSHLVDLLENEKNSEIIVLDNLVSGKKSNINFKSKKISFII